MQLLDREWMKLYSFFYYYFCDGKRKHVDNRDGKKKLEAFEQLEAFIVKMCKNTIKNVTFSLYRLSKIKTSPILF